MKATYVAWVVYNTVGEHPLSLSVNGISSVVWSDEASARRAMVQALNLDPDLDLRVMKASVGPSNE